MICAMCLATSNESPVLNPEPFRHRRIRPRRRTGPRRSKMGQVVACPEGATRNPEPVSNMEIGLSLGANLGNRLLQLQEAKKQIIATRGISFIVQSPVYETEPVDVPPMGQNMFFLNAVLIIETSLQIPELLSGFQRIERKLGRAPNARPNAPRLIDIDIIYADKLRIGGEGINVPHPRWFERRFVVRPLNDVRPDLVIPGQTGTVTEVLRDLSDKYRVMLFKKEW